MRRRGYGVRVGLPVAHCLVCGSYASAARTGRCRSQGVPLPVRNPGEYAASLHTIDHAMTFAAPDLLYAVSTRCFSTIVGTLSSYLPASLLGYGEQHSHK